MSTLTTKIRKVVGKGSSSSGRGMSWLYVGDKEDRRGYNEQKKVIDLMIENFPCWKMVRNVPNVGEMIDYHFFISSNRGNEYGCCQMSERRKEDNSSLVIINYSYEDHEKIHQYNRNYEDVISYEQIN